MASLISIYCNNDKHHQAEEEVGVAVAEPEPEPPKPAPPEQLAEHRVTRGEEQN